MGTLQSVADVSRETSEALQIYHDLLLRWTNSINLIAPSTVAAAWDRHIADSAQLFTLVPVKSRMLVDIGSGGGLPGLVLAIMAREDRPGLAVALIESDQRKCAFLRTVVRELALNATVICDRIEAVTDVSADVLTARALAPLGQLLAYADQLLSPEGVALFQKGRNVDVEIASAQDRWAFDMTRHVSLTDADARVLEIKDIRRASH